MPCRIAHTFRTASCSAPDSGTKLFMYDRLSSICAMSLMPDSTMKMPANPAANRIA